MRRILRLTLAAAGALTFAACSRDAAAPASTDDVSALLGSDLAVLGSFGAGTWAAGGDAAAAAGPAAGPGHVGMLLRALPPELRLTDAQLAQIRSLVDAFNQANHGDREALGAIRHQAEEARRAGKTRAEIEQILAAARPIVERIAAAEATLARQIQGVLTDAQRAWLAAHTPARCDAPGVALTDEQKAQISSLVQAFETTNRADLDAVKATLDAAQAARRSGKTRAEVEHILASARPALRRLEAARLALQHQIQDVLTAEQKASRCYR